MANEYVDLATAKDWLAITDTAQDAILAIILEAGSRAIDDYCARRFYLDAGTSVRFYTAADPGHVFIDDVDSAAPTITVETDDDNDGTFERSWTRDNLTNYGYRLEPLNAEAMGRPYTAILALSGRFPRTNQGLRITAKHGYAADAPPAVKTALMVQVQTLWTPSGILEDAGGSPSLQSLQLEGSDAVTFSSANVAALAAKELSEGAKELLAPFVRYQT